MFSKIQEKVFATLYQDVRGREEIKGEYGGVEPHPFNQKKPDFQGKLIHLCREDQGIRLIFRKEKSFSFSNVFSK